MDTPHTGTTTPRTPARLSTPRPPDVPAGEATLFLPTPLHPKSEAYAESLFKKVVRPKGQGGEMSWGECLEVADAALVRIGKFTAADIAAAPRLKIIARNGTGYDSIDLDACRAHGVVVTNMPGTNAAEVAELTVALALAVLRRIVEANNRIRSGERLPSIKLLAPGLLGKTVGLVGMGDISAHAARLFAAFGCEILVYSPTSPLTRWTAEDPRGEIKHTRVDSLDALLPAVDVLSLHCPLSPETADMISGPQLAKMRTTAVLINTARGGLVDEAALASALKNGVIGGAGLDVLRTEPAFGANLAHLDLPNTVLLPHLGGNTEESAERGCTLAIDLVVEYLAGGPVRNRVA